MHTNKKSQKGDRKVGWVSMRTVSLAVKYPFFMTPLNIASLRISQHRIASHRIEECTLPNPSIWHLASRHLEPGIVLNILRLKHTTSKFHNG